jgi:hypothetical protein
MARKYGGPWQSGAFHSWPPPNQPLKLPVAFGDLLGAPIQPQPLDDLLPVRRRESAIPPRVRAPGSRGALGWVRRGAPGPIHPKVPLSPFRLSRVVEAVRSGPRPRRRHGK